MSDTTVELVPLLAGEICLTTRFEFAPPGPLPQQRTLLAQALRLRRHWAPIPAFLLRHPTEGDVLIDAGIDPSVEHDPVETLGPATGRLFPTTVRPLRPQLERLGAEPHTVVMTHLHSDHISGIGELRGTTMVCDRREWEATFAPLSWLNGYVRNVAESVGDKRLLDLGSGEPHGPFASTHDLFGDGSVRVCSTPGHSVGHCSILVRTSEGDVLLCGDAAGSERQLYDLWPSSFFADRAQTLSSLAAIQRWRRDNPDGLAVPGHDPGWTRWLATSGDRHRA